MPPFEMIPNQRVKTASFEIINEYHILIWQKHRFIKYPLNHYRLYVLTYY
ncbi:hypothetical protein Hanom_Chr09g00848311 [Helianthus anomalus]